MVCSAEAKEAAFGSSTSYAAFPLIAQQLKRAVVRLGPVGFFAGIWAAVITAVFRVVGLFRGGLTEVLPCSIGNPLFHACTHAWKACLDRMRAHARTHAREVRRCCPPFSGDISISQSCPSGSSVGGFSAVFNRASWPSTCTP